MRRQDEIKVAVKFLVEGLTDYEMLIAIGCIKSKMIERAGCTRETHFVCPITSKVLAKRSSKKIVVSHKETKKHVTTSWYNLSMKAYNNIIQRSEKR